MDTSETIPKITMERKVSHVFLNRLFVLNTTNLVRHGIFQQVWLDYDTSMAEKVGASESAKLLPSRDKKILECPYCDYTFPRLSHFERHYRIHTGEKPFSCEHCLNSTSDKSNLIKHMWIHLMHTKSALSQVKAIKSSEVNYHAASPML